MLAKVSPIRTCSAKASLALCHTMIISMHENMSQEALSQESFGGENIEQVPQTVASTIIYSAFESMPFGFLYQGRRLWCHLFIHVYTEEV